MERLTEKHYLADDHYMKCSENCDADMDCIDCPAFDKLIERLAAYEDTGLTPEEVLPKEKADEIAIKLMRLADLQSFCEYSRLRELAEADKEGRVVVLPCKVGDTVYVTDLTDGKVEECEVAYFSCIDGTGGGLIEYNAPPDYPRIVSIECGLDEIGESVFLTRGEAEEALRERQEEDQ